MYEKVTRRAYGVLCKVLKIFRISRPLLTP